MEYIIVQAGGRGSRLKQLTENKPKALVPVDNLPILFHLFRKYPDRKFVIIADYKEDVMRRYLAAFADVEYQVVPAEGTGTCAGIQRALEQIPADCALMLIWSDLILPDGFELPAGYGSGETARDDYVGISETFPCRWSFIAGDFWEKPSKENGVAGFFLFSDKSKLRSVPESGEFVEWLQAERKAFRTVSLAGTREVGLLAEYEKLGRQVCRPFNRISVSDGVLTKEPVDSQGEKLAQWERNWYKKAAEYNSGLLPRIDCYEPLKMEYIQGGPVYSLDLPYEKKRTLLEQLVRSLQELHQFEKVPAEPASIKEAYYTKTMDRLSKIGALVPFAGEREITINGRTCRNVLFHTQELEARLEALECEAFHLIHGDCTFSNLLLREDGRPVLIDPRGYFGHTALYGDQRYDWAKLYYSIVGNYDRFNLKEFSLHIGSSPKEGARLEIASNGWEALEGEFFRLTGAEKWEIKLLHAIIWLSLTTYAWQDYDSICGAFYNGLFYLEEIL